MLLLVLLPGLLRLPGLLLLLQFPRLVRHPCWLGQVT